MHQTLLLVDLEGVDAVLFGQPEDAVLSRSDVSSAQVNPLDLLILKNTSEHKQMNKKSVRFTHRAERSAADHKEFID